MSTIFFEVQMKIRAYYREGDGHTYIYSRAECEWIAFPTFKTGDPDWLNPTVYSDINLSDEDMKKLIEWLAKRTT
jgi:hypothetical protein